MTVNNSIQTNVEQLKQLFELLGHSLCDAICASHQHFNIDEKAVIDDISSPIGDIVILREDQIAPSTNLYRQMDTLACLNYLYYGGSRKSKASGGKRYCKDQDAFFAFFKIKYGYCKQNGRRALKLDSVFYEALANIKAVGEEMLSGTPSLSNELYHKSVLYMLLIASTLYLNDQWENDARLRCNELIEKLTERLADKYRS
jgi:hypothetical protein